MYIRDIVSFLEQEDKKLQSKNKKIPLTDKDYIIFILPFKNTISFLSRHEIEYVKENNKIFADNFYIFNGVKIRYWLPLTQAIGKKLLSFILND